MSIPSEEDMKYYREHAADTFQPNLIAVAICGLIVAYGGVLARAIAKRQAKARYGLDDWLIIVALAPLTGYAICTFVMVSLGSGRHMIFVTSPKALISSYVAAITNYAVANITIKLSVLYFFRRRLSSKALVWIIYAIGFVTILYNGASVIITALECALSTGEEICLRSYLPLRVALSAINSLTDMAIIALPIPHIWQLELTRVKKFQVNVVFLLAALVCLFSVARVVSIATSPQTNKSYTQAYSGIWSFAEISMGVFVACLPTLSGLCNSERLARVIDPVKTLYGRIIRSSESSNGKESPDRPQRADSESGQVKETWLYRLNSLHEDYSHSPIGPREIVVRPVR